MTFSAVLSSSEGSFTKSKMSMIETALARYCHLAAG